MNDVGFDDTFTHLLLADQLDAVMDQLASQVPLQRSQQARDRLISFLYAHSQAATALRQFVAGSYDSQEHMREATMLLERVTPDDFVIF
ncbi:hypothetical protein CFN78_16440 [Amycolatopsis antarctica]|uniref:Uncharacterized protein n=1 Tax=Amycolatopsis antarctica TaxID=1854586 RepID=A0A263D3D2_9PSEU|nr:hypothetical protein CFN78_16440 [Amycolatopsis antarctica]